jgi:NAD(P)-dependent dehydrogenase (short-subunit alcohol dehydrogenase family)
MSEKKIVVITGASKGLGRVLVDIFVKSDWHVVGTGRSVRPPDFPTAAQYVQFDASDAHKCDDFWQQIKQTHPEASIVLINNAGGYIGGEVTETDPSEFENQMKANFFPAVYMTRGLTEIVDSARVITVISSTAHAPQKSNAAYGASKAAEKYFLQTFQKEMTSSKFQITNIYPNDIATKGPNALAIDPIELASLIKDTVDTQASYYIRDITLHATGS